MCRLTVQILQTSTNDEHFERISPKGRERNGENKVKRIKTVRKDKARKRIGKNNDDGRVKEKVGRK